MKALLLNSDGKTPRLQLREAPTPSPSANDVLVQVAACGVCYHDIAVIEGTLRRGIKPNIILGHEVAGTVASIGSEVTSVQTGDRVTAALTAFCGKCPRCAQGKEYRCLNGHGFGHALDGGFAQYMRLPESSVIPIPDSIDLAQAALLACPIAVALNALQDVANLKSGETALIVGAGGGLGVHLAQTATALGAQVIAVTSSPHKLNALESIPNIFPILADDQLDFSEIVLALTDDNGADVVLNPVGSTLFASCLASLAQFGRMILLGEIAGRPARFNPAELLFRDAAIIGATGASPRHIRSAINMVASGSIKPLISQQFTFDQAAEAIDQMRAATPFGRIALIPPPP